jgi:hypothetical protein
MARYPDAIWKPITASKGRDRLAVWNRMNLHVAVSEASTLHHVFNVSGQVDSHFYVRRDGTIEQYVDTAWQAFADLDGNDATISVETQGMGGGGWTPEQRESLARLYAWAVKTHGIARKMATSSKVGAESKGLSWHRLGCDGNFPSLPSILAGRSQRGGGMRYTKHFGKVCPGDGRVVQIPGIFDRAMDILNDGPSTPTQEEPDMDKNDRQIAADTLAAAQKALDLLDARVIDGPAGEPKEQDRLTVTGALRRLLVEQRALAGRSATRDAAQTAAITALAKSVGIDPAKIEAIVQKAVDNALDTEYVLTPKES